MFSCTYWEVYFEPTYLSKYLLLSFQDLQHIISITCNYVDCCLTFLGKVFIDLRSPGGGDGRWQQRRQLGRWRLCGRPSLSSKGFSFFEEIWNKRETYCKSCIALCRSSVRSTFNFGVHLFNIIVFFFQKDNIIIRFWFLHCHLNVILMLNI